MYGLSLKSIRHYKALFIGTFVIVMMGVASIGLVILVISATQSLPSGELGPQVTLTDPNGAVHTFSRDANDVQGIATALGLSAVISGFMTIIGISSACTFAITLRRRDLGLLSLLGVNRGHLRRMIVGETVATAIPAALLGCSLAAQLAPWTLHTLNQTPLVPIPLPEHVNLLPLAGAYVLGVVLAIVAALIASRQATKVRPIEALREATLDAHIMTRGRWIAGLVGLAAGLLMALGSSGSTPSNATALAIFGTIALTVAGVILAPVYLPYIGQLLDGPARWFNWRLGHMAVASVTNSRRRTSLLLAPLLSIIAIAGIMLGIMETTTATMAVDQQVHTKSQLVATTGNRGLSPETLQQLRAIPKTISVVAPGSLKVAFAAPGRSMNNPPGTLSAPLGSGGVSGNQNTFGQSEAMVVDLQQLATVQSINAVEGLVKPLARNEIAVRQEFISWYGVRAGSTMQLGLFDGRVVTVRVVAVIKGGANLPNIIMSPQLADTQIEAPHSAFILTEPGSEVSVQERSNTLTGVRVITTQTWYEHIAENQRAIGQLALFILVVPASIFALIAIANALIMAFSRRGREVASMMLLGIESGQLRRMVAIETGTVVGIGISLAALFVGLGISGYTAALRHDYLAAQFQMPWQPIGVLIGSCIVVSMVTSHFALRRLQKKSAMNTIAMRE